jgi:hypothetical protein
MKNVDSVLAQEPGQNDLLPGDPSCRTMGVDVGGDELEVRLFDEGLDPSAGEDTIVVAGIQARKTDDEFPDVTAHTSVTERPLGADQLGIDCDSHLDRL